VSDLLLFKEARRRGRVGCPKICRDQLLFVLPDSRG